MTIKDYKFSYDCEYTYNYSEESQATEMRWCIVGVDHKGKRIHAPRVPFQCREFLIDYVFWIASDARGSMYGMGFSEEPNPDLDHTYLAIMTSEEDEAHVLRQLCDVEITGEDLPVCKGISWGSGDVEMEYCFVTRIPEYARSSPLGMALWTLGIRGHVENKRVTPDHYGFGIPEVLEGGNNGEILDCLYGGAEFLNKLWARKRTFLWNVDDEDYEIGECTHEAFSPCTLFSALESDIRFERFMDCAEENAWDEQFYQVPQLKLLKELNS